MEEDASLREEISEFLYYACCCFMCPCDRDGCCSCCPCYLYGSWHDKLEDDREALLPRENSTYGTQYPHVQVQVISEQPKTKTKVEGEEGRKSPVDTRTSPKVTGMDDSAEFHSTEEDITKESQQEEDSNGGQQEIDEMQQQEVNEEEPREVVEEVIQQEVEEVTHQPVDLDTNTPPDAALLGKSVESQRMDFAKEDEDEEEGEGGEEKGDEEVDTKDYDVEEKEDAGVSATLSWGEFEEDDDDEETEVLQSPAKKDVTVSTEPKKSHGTDADLLSPPTRYSPKSSPSTTPSSSRPSSKILNIVASPSSHREEDSDSSAEEYFAPTVSAKKKVEEVDVNTRKILFEWRAPAKKVNISGDFNDWKEQRMKKNSEGVFQYQTTLEVGRYFYRFKVDKKWTVDDQWPVVSKGEGKDNTYNVVEVR